MKLITKHNNDQITFKVTEISPGTEKHFILHTEHRIFGKIMDY